MEWRRRIKTIAQLNNASQFGGAAIPGNNIRSMLRPWYHTRPWIPIKVYFAER
jgi:hypothetical protein